MSVWRNLSVYTFCMILTVMKKSSNSTSPREDQLSNKGKTITFPHYRWHHQLEGRQFLLSLPLQNPNIPLTFYMVSDCLSVTAQRVKRSCRTVENTWARDRHLMNECYVWGMRFGRSIETAGKWFTTLKEANWQLQQSFWEILLLSAKFQEFLKPS